MSKVLRFALQTGCAALLFFVVMEGPTGCGDGGWGSGPPDTLLEPPADGGGGTGGDGVADAGGGEDAAVADTGGVTYECGKGPANENGIGAQCTKGGNECKDDQNCDIDLDPQGAGLCIMLMCTGDSQCGSRATCCAPAQGGGIKVCLINDCLPPECGGAAPDGGSQDGAQDGDGSFDGAQDGGGRDGGGGGDGA